MLRVTAQAGNRTKDRPESLVVGVKVYYGVCFDM